MPLLSEEIIIKEHPNFTHCRREGQSAKDVGNLILTNTRLVFLTRVMLHESKMERWQKLAKEGTAAEQIDFALTLHKKNFNIPLSLLSSVKCKLYFSFPFPSLIMQISYMKGGSKKKGGKTMIFQFKQSFLRLLFRKSMLPLTVEWVSSVREAIKNEEVSSVKA